MDNTRNRPGGIGKKPMSAPCSNDVARYLMSCSKAALADCVCDLINGNGDPSLDEVISNVEPRLIARGDSLPKKK